MEKPLELSASIASVAKGQERDKVALKEGQEKKKQTKRGIMSVAGKGIGSHLEYCQQFWSLYQCVVA